MKKIEELRKQIDEIDNEMRILFEKRIEIIKKIGIIKKENNTSIKDANRENEVINNNVLKLQDLTLANHYEQFIRTIMNISCNIQENENKKN